VPDWCLRFLRCDTTTKHRASGVPALAARGCRAQAVTQRGLLVAVCCICDLAGRARWNLTKQIGLDVLRGGKRRTRVVRGDCAWAPWPSSSLQPPS
jgi:hypothetical protein